MFLPEPTKVAWPFGAASCYSSSAGSRNDSSLESTIRVYEADSGATYGRHPNPSVDRSNEGEKGTA